MGRRALQPSFSLPPRTARLLAGTPASILTRASLRHQATPSPGSSRLTTRVTISQIPTPLARPEQSTRGLPSPLTALEGPCFTPRISARVRLMCLVPISSLPYYPLCLQVLL